MKDCGSCRHFTKCKNDEYSGGMCDFHDCRTGTDHRCEYWKGKKYNRKLIQGPYGETPEVV